MHQIKFQNLNITRYWRICDTLALDDRDYMSKKISKVPSFCTFEKQFKGDNS